MKLDSLIWYMKNGKVHSAKVLSIMRVENLHNDWNANEEQINLFKPFGEQGVYYSTAHGVIEQRYSYESKEMLLASL